MSNEINYLANCHKSYVNKGQGITEKNIGSFSLPKHIAKVIFSLWTGIKFWDHENIKW